MIRVENLSKHFGGLKAVDRVSVDIAKGSITGLIGPNGAGKTTLFNAIAGLYAPTQGSVFLDDEDITGLKLHELFQKGLLRTFQIAHEFSRLTVTENLMMVPAMQSGENLLKTWFNRSQVAREEQAIHDKAQQVIDFLNLTHIADELAGNLRYYINLLDADEKLLAYGNTLRATDDVAVDGAAYFLLVLRPEDSTLEITAYKSNQLEEAYEEYLKYERQILLVRSEQLPLFPDLANYSGAQAVLVGADSLKSLRRSYPNYYLDTKQFLVEVNRFVYEY